MQKLEVDDYQEVSCPKNENKKIFVLDRLGCKGCSFFNRESLKKEVETSTLRMDSIVTFIPCNFGG